LIIGSPTSNDETLNVLLIEVYRSAGVYLFRAFSDFKSNFGSPRIVVLPQIALKAKGLCSF